MKQFTLLVFAVGLLTGCATLLNLPDNQTEDFYRNNGKITKDQITRNMTSSAGAKVNSSAKEEIRVLPIIYSYTTYNNLKKGEEVYYTSRYTNHSWFRDFMMTAHNEIVTQLKNRGMEASYYKNVADLANGKDVEQVFRTGESRRGTPLRIAAFNVDPNTNYGLVDRNNLRKYMDPSDQGVLLALFDVDWSPNTANTLNDDIVLNSNVNMGFNMLFCSSKGCSEISIPFTKGVQAFLPMPNKNTIDDDGLKKNQVLIKELHGEQLKQIIAAAFEKLDAQKAFSK